MLSDWQQKKIDEERMLKEYNSTSDKNNINNYVEKIHQKEIEKLNTNYHIDNQEATESISSSIKYLMRKKNRSNKVKIEKFEFKENTKKNNENKNKMKEYESSKPNSNVEEEKIDNFIDINNIENIIKIKQNNKNLCCNDRKNYDNISQISDKSNDDLNKEDLEKELFDFY